MFQLATMECRSHLHIFLSLAVNCENKVLKVCCVPRLSLQKFTLLKLHHPHKPRIVFLHQEPHSPSTKYLFPYITPTKQQLSCYNPIKTSFLTVVIAPVPFPFWFHTGHATFGLMLFGRLILHISSFNHEVQKYWIWISKNKSIAAAWNDVDYSSIQNCVWACHLVSVRK